MSDSTTSVCSGEAMRSITRRIAAAAKNNALPRLVAVSKRKPAELIQEYYDLGQRHFGENYVKELCQKSSQLPEDIQWHFIGHLQRNKCKQLLGVRNLYAVETVDSSKLASKLNAECAQLGREPLNVFIQVNTSGEASKSGVSPQESISLARIVQDECPHLRMKGLMTIGRSGDPEGTDMVRLFDCREELSADLGIPSSEIELSMGMSNDFEKAIELGSTNIRLGTVLFGKRDPLVNESSEPDASLSPMSSQREAKDESSGLTSAASSTDQSSFSKQADSVPKS